MIAAFIHISYIVYELTSLLRSATFKRMDLPFTSQVVRFFALSRSRMYSRQSWIFFSTIDERSVRVCERVCVCSRMCMCVNVIIDNDSLPNIIHFGTDYYIPFPVMIYAEWIRERFLQPANVHFTRRDGPSK